MLLIEQIYEPDSIKGNYVRCPVCKRGRLCDKLIGEKTLAIPIRSDTLKNRSGSIILKCPCCSRKFVISFTTE